MDFPVEATVHLNRFQDETEVKNILTSHGFKMKDLGGGQVRVKGHFFKLKDAKDELDQLLRSQTQMSPNSSSAGPAASSGAVPKNYGPRNEAPRASPSSPSSSSSSAPGSSHSRPASPVDRRGSLRRDVSCVIDADVFRYADKFKNKEINDILVSHGVKMNPEERGDTVSIALRGSNSKTAMSKLQSLMGELSKSLRTQDVPLEDVSPSGRLLLEDIKRNRNVGAVLVCQTAHRLHLVGSSSESHELKQRLLGSTSGRAGRSSAKSSRRRSSSAPPANRKSTEAAADRNPSPGGATGYSPRKYQDDKRGAAADHGRGRSPAQSRENKDAKMVNGNKREEEGKPSSGRFPKIRDALMKDLANIKRKAKWK